MQNRNCISCLKEFKAKQRSGRNSGFQRFCSVDCYRAWRKGKFFKGMEIGVFKKGISPWNIGKQHSDETRKKMSIKARRPKPGNKEEKNFFWKGGISPLRLRLHASFHYKDWRRRIFKRDNFTCQICFITDVPFHIDHFPKSYSEIIQQYQITSVQDALVCEELWDINNGRVLCVPCHQKTKTFACKTSIKKQ